MPKSRIYIQARNLLQEAHEKIKDYDTILGTVKKEYEKLRRTGIKCKAFEGETILEVTRQCWNHVFKHPKKRQTKIEKLERALCFNMAIKLLLKTTTYQGVSREKERGRIKNGAVFDSTRFRVAGRIKGLPNKRERSLSAPQSYYSMKIINQATYCTVP